MILPRTSSGATAPASCLGPDRHARGTAGPGWVEAVAIAGGRVIAAGPLDEVEAALAPGARRLRLAPDEVAIPGLTDAHLHLAEAALARRRVNLDDARSIEDARRARRARRRGGTRAAQTWIEGAGWDPDLVGRWPTADDLEIAAPGRLVALWAHDHHALLVSTAALAAAGIDADRSDPDGGVIRRDEDGRATGVLHETAVRLVASLVPPPTTADVEDALGPLVRELVGLGVVAVHDPGGLGERRDLDGPIGAYRDLAAAGRLGSAGARLHPARSSSTSPRAEGLRSGGPLGPDPLDRLRMGWLKTFADGSLGSRTAALLEPLERVAGEPPPPNDGYGVWLVPPDELRAQAERAAALGITTQIHGIGDAAVRAALDALAPTVGRTALMPRVEHAQLVHRDDIPRFAALGIAASMQPIHVRSDAEKARRLWGARAEAWAYAFARAGPGRRGHRVRDRRAGGAGRPVARPGLRGDPVVARVAGGEPPFGPPERASGCGGPCGPRAWTRRSRPARRTAGGSSPGSGPTSS